jgi:hypothetical protein
MAVHMAKRSARCGTFHDGVAVHAERPLMLPYMSRAIGTSHHQQAPATSSSDRAHEPAIADHRALEAVRSAT